MNFFSNKRKAFSMAIRTSDEPKCFKKDALCEQWKEAMRNEIKDLKENKMWVLEEVPLIRSGCTK